MAGLKVAGFAFVVIGMFFLFVGLIESPHLAVAGASTAGLIGGCVLIAASHIADALRKRDS